MSDIDLDAIEARANAATPGPWLVLRGMDCTHVRAQDGHFETGCINWDGRDASDADFIAAARTDIPALIARVREQEQEIAVQRDRAACWRAYAEHLRWCRQCAEGPQCHDGDALRDTALGAEATRA